MSRHAATAARVVKQVTSGLGPDVELITAAEREWESATFSGTRHCLDLAIGLPQADAPPPRFLTALPDHEFDLPGEIVADCCVMLGQRETGASGQTRLHCRVELLTIRAD